MALKNQVKKLIPPGDTSLECILTDDVSNNSSAPIACDSINVLFQDPNAETRSGVNGSDHNVVTDNNVSTDHEPEALKSDGAQKPPPPLECEECSNHRNGDTELSPNTIRKNTRMYHHIDNNIEKVSSQYNIVNNAYKKLKYKFRFPKNHRHVNNTIDINKLSTYKTEESRKRYVFPSPANEAKDEDMCLTDDRNILEVFGDVLGIITDLYDPEDAEWLSRVVGYDVTIPQINRETGVHMPQELLKHLVREYKEMHGIKNINKALREHIEKTLGEAGKLDPVDPVDSVDSVEAGGVAIIEVPPYIPDDQLDAEGCLNFVSGHMYVLESASRRRLHRVLANRKRSGKSLSNKRSRQFVRELQGKYYDADTKSWRPPEATEANLPGQCFLVAQGTALFYLHGSVGTNDDRLTAFSCLLDTGATHDILPLSYARKRNIKLGPISKRGKMHLFTAGSEVKDSVEGECTITVCITGRNGEQYYAPINFLVVNDNLSVTKPILGRPWHKLFACHARYDSDTVTAELFNKDWEKVRIEIPHTSTSGTAAFCNKVTETETQDYDSGVESMDDEADTDCRAREMVGSILQVYGHTPARDVFTSLGGDSNEVELEIKDDLDDMVFDRMDLLATLDGYKQKKQSQTCKTIKEKYIKKINAVVDNYPEAVSTEDRITGRFKYWNYSPDVIPGKTAFQKNRNTKIDHFPAAVEKMKELQRHGIIQISDSQSKDFIHNILIQHKKNTDQVGRGWSKADQAIGSRHNKLSDPNVKIRLLNDLTTFNYCLRHIPTIALPREAEIRSFIRHKYVSLLDLKNMFYSICVDPSAYHYFNFYYNKTIMTMTRLCQGLASSPYVAVEALKRALDQSVWKALYSRKREDLPLLFQYYNSFSELNISFIDDILVASYILCKCQDGRCGQGVECPTFDQDLTCELHIQCFEGILWAIQESGFLIEKKKMELFVQSKFIFLGTEYSSTANSYGIAMDRAKSILNFRIPKSVPELGSRLSALFWSAPTIPYVKKVALPLSKILLQNHFEWGPRQMKAWNNVKLMVSLSISILNIFDENRYGVLVSDSSKWSASYTFYQIDENGRLLLVQTDTKVLNGSESRRVAVYRELACSTWAMGEIQHFILASKKQVLVLADAQSILFLKQTQAWDGALAKVALFVSKFQNIVLSFLPGKYMGVCDIFSRQFHNAYITKSDAPLSRIMSEIIAPPPKALYGKTFLMTPEDLTSYLMSENRRTKLDLWDKGEYARQELKEYDFRKCLGEAQPLQSLLKYLKNPYNINNLNTRTVKDLFKVLTGASKTKIDAFIKDSQLDHLRTTLKSIDYKSDWKMVYQPITKDGKEGKPIVGWEPDMTATDDGVQEAGSVTQIRPSCTMVWSHANDYVPEDSDPLLLPASVRPGEGIETGQVLMVVTRSSRRALVSSSNMCVTDHKQHVNLLDKASQCRHIKSLPPSLVITNECYDNFRKKYEFWADFVDKVTGLLKLDKSKDDRGQYNRLLNKLQQYKEATCIVAKIVATRDLCVMLSSSQLLPNILSSNLTKVLIVLFTCESSDWYLRERGGKLFVCPSRKIVLEPLDFIQLKGHCIILNQDIAVTQKYNKNPHVKMYYDITHVQVSLCQGISLYNTDIVPVTLEEGVDMFEITVDKTGNMTVYFAEIPKEQSDQLLNCLSHLVMDKERCRFTEIMSDYFCELNSIMTQDTQAAMAGMTLPPISVATVNTIAATLEGDDDTEVDQMDNQVRTDTELEYHGKLELSALLFSHQLRRGRKYISKDRMVALQNSDRHLVDIKERLAASPGIDDGTRKQLYVLENDILYRNTYINKYDMTFKTLCLPTFLLKVLIQNIHTYYQLHISTDDLYCLLRTAIYANRMFELLREARLSCPVCVFSHPAESRKVRGNKLIWRHFKKGPNFICYADLCELPYCHELRSSMMLVYMCGLTQYTVALPLTDKSDSSIVKAFRQIFSILPCPGVLATDAGSEFVSRKTRSFLEDHHVQQFFPGTKDGGSIIEGGIRILKQLINAYVQRAGGAPGDWSEAYVHALQTLNAKHAGKHGLLSRRDMFLSPLTYCNPLHLSIAGDSGDLPRVHKTHIKRRQDQMLRLVSKKGARGATLYKGRVVTKVLPRVLQPSINGSRQLGPSTERFLKIRKVLSGGKIALAKCLSSGKKIKAHIEELRPLTMWPWPDASIRLKNLVNFVPEVHSHKYAKRLAGLEEPKIFTVNSSPVYDGEPVTQSEALDLVPDQSEDRCDEVHLFAIDCGIQDQENGVKDQSEDRETDSDQLEAGPWRPPPPQTPSTDPKSILKVRQAKIHQPLMAELTRTPKSRAQLESYYKAFRLNLWLNRTDSKWSMSPPDWVRNLVQQGPSFGTNLMCHRNSLTPAVACSHNRKVSFGKGVRANEQVKYVYCHSEGLANMRENYSVSNREAAMCYICCFSCLEENLNMREKCENNSQCDQSEAE